MAAGLFICFLLSLAVVDYVFDMDIKNWLCSHMPKWTALRKLRDHFDAKGEELDAKFREEEIRAEEARPLGLYSIFDSSITSVINSPGEPIKVVTASGTVYIVVKERSDLPKDILAVASQNSDVKREDAD